MSDTALAFQPQDIELIKKGKKENPTWLTAGEKAVKWYKCEHYGVCLSNGEKRDAANWSCVNCKFVKDAQVGDLIIFRTRNTLNKNDLKQILKFEVLHQIKSSKTDNRIY